MGKSGKDIWWDLSNNQEAISTEVLDLLVQNGEHYFSMFASREKLIEQWEQERLQKRLSQRQVFIMAVILNHCGEKIRASELLNTEFGGQYKTTFLEYAQNIAKPLGMDFPTLK